MQLLDIPGTLEATVRSAGYPSVRFRPSSKTPEYVFLIEERSERDHLAAWMLSVVGALAESHVAIEAYIYRGDPRRAYRFNLLAGPAGRGVTGEIGRAHV